jgi:hypothetical protein
VVAARDVEDSEAAEAEAEDSDAAAAEVEDSDAAAAEADSDSEDTNHLKHTGRVADSEGMEVAVDVAVGVKVVVDKELQSPNLGNFSRM